MIANILDSATQFIGAPMRICAWTIDEFCAAERISRSMLYKARAQRWGPYFYRIGVTRRISHRARLAWQREREAEAAAERDEEKGND